MSDVVPRKGPLSGVKVLDLSRLAPGPYCTMLLADMGAEIIVVGGGSGSLPIGALARGKTFINLDLKSEDGKIAFRTLVQDADVLVEGYRPGVAARLGIGYAALAELNPGLIYCSLTGYGQSGPLSQEAGHDINYLALSGALGAFGPLNEAPMLPLNLLADFAGGSLFAVIGILAALNERGTSGKGQYIDAAMVDGCLSLMTMHFSDWGQPVLPARGDGLLTGSAPFYRCYACSDGKFIAVGALEDRFFFNLWNALGFEDEAPQQLDRRSWASMTQRFTTAFMLRSRDEWVSHFRGEDACVSPVLAPDEALNYPHNAHRHPYAKPGVAVEAPLMAHSVEPVPVEDNTDRSRAVLSRAGLADEIVDGAIPKDLLITGLSWPPM